MRYKPISHCNSHQDSGIDAVTNVTIHYSVNGGNTINLTLQHQGSNNITDIMLPDVQYNDNISIQISLQNATTMTRRSDPLTLRMYNALILCSHYVLISCNLTSYLYSSYIIIPYGISWAT